MKVNKKHYLFKHGMIKTRFYKIWRMTKTRTLNKNTPDYIDYGGRGIKISKSWLSFINFKKDMFKLYSKHIKKYGIANTQIDRINNNKGYNKQNCHWVTPKQNSRNRRDNIKLYYKGDKKLLIEWCEKFNIPYCTVYHRLFIYSWDIEKAFKKPIRIKTKK